jgi:hypothetical protein
MNRSEEFYPTRVDPFAHDSKLQQPTYALTKGGRILTGFKTIHDGSTETGPGWLSVYSGKGAASLRLQLQGCPVDPAHDAYMKTCLATAKRLDPTGTSASDAHFTYARFWKAPTPIPNGKDTRYVLQYWYFYWADNWYDSSNWEWLAQQHQGDVELAQIDLNASGYPISVDVSEHSCGFARAWSDPKVIHSRHGYNHIALFVARGSHSLWFQGGNHQLGPNQRCGDYGMPSGPRQKLATLGFHWYDYDGAHAGEYRVWNGSKWIYKFPNWIWPQAWHQKYYNEPFDWANLTRISMSTPWMAYRGHWGANESVVLGGLYSYQDSLYGPPSIRDKAAFLNPLAWPGTFP